MLEIPAGDSGRCAIDHRVLRELIRNLQAFEALHETEGKDVINGPDGTSYSLHDLRRLYDMRDQMLPRQRARAIEFFLYRDMREQDAARAMGLSAETPVAIYATQGLRQLAAEWESAALWCRQRGGGSGGEPGIVPDEAALRDVPAA